MSDELGLGARLEQLERGEIAATDLAASERRALLFLARRDRSQVALARLFGVSRACIQKDLKALRREVARSIDLDTVVGGLVLAAHALSERASENDDPGTAWRIHRELVETLVDLGVVARAPPSGEGLKFSLEALGAGFERAGEILAQGLDPRLTGEVVESVAARRDAAPE